MATNTAGQGAGSSSGGEPAGWQQRSADARTTGGTAQAAAQRQTQLRLTGQLLVDLHRQPASMHLLWRRRGLAAFGLVPLGGRLGHLHLILILKA